MPQNTILHSSTEHIARITLNRPEAGNFIDRQLARELDGLCRQINQDDDVYVVTLTGAGSAFCAGSKLEQLSQSGNSIDSVMEHSAAAAIADIDRPVIAAINGDALGQGLELALACDIRLASDKAHFGLPQVSGGLIPLDGGTQRLPRIVGKAKALELVLTAETLNAQAAFEIGLVNRVVPADRLAAEVESLAKTMASKGPVALRYIKEAVNKGLDLTLEQGLRLEADLYFLLHTTADRQEGVKAFLEKRTPEFRGK
ncbi:MAG: enoyl-CoA hydratase/isomerase family protein [Chloroflexi bacterium]|nr:enoyl-CoA hydratase/isomerase family protein [Chloroflexota bacterium]